MEHTLTSHHLLLYLRKFVGYLLVTIPVVLFIFALYLTYVRRPPRKSEAFKHDRLIWVLNGPEKYDIAPPEISTRREYLEFYLKCLDHDDRWVNVRAARVLGEDLLYYPIRKKLLSLAIQENDNKCRRYLLWSLGEIAKDDCVDGIISIYHDPNLCEVRYRSIEALRNVKDRKARSFLIEQATTSPDEDMAYAAARILATKYWDKKSIKAVTAYLNRDDARLETSAWVNIPVRLQVMKNTRSLILIKILCLGLLPFISIFVYLYAKKCCFPVKKPLLKVFIVEVILLTLLLFLAISTFAAAFGGGDAGAMNSTFLGNRNFQLSLLLIGFYALAIPWLAFLLNAVHDLYKHGYRHSKYLAILCSLCFLLINVFIVLINKPYTWVVPVG